MSDRGGELIFHVFECFLPDNGIENRVSSPYTPEQNRVAERVNWDLLTIMHAALQDSGLARRVWDVAILHAAYTLNFCPKSTPAGALPHTSWFGKAPDVSHLFELG